MARVADGELSVNEIAAPSEMSQPGVSRHLKVLEHAGLVERDVDQQRRPARLKADPMVSAVDWLNEFERFWETSFEQLDNVLCVPRIGMARTLKRSFTSLIWNLVGSGSTK